MAKIEIIYKSGKKETLETESHDADSLRKELEIAVAHKKSYMEVDGFPIFPNLIKEVREVK